MAEGSGSSLSLCGGPREVRADDGSRVEHHPHARVGPLGDRPVVLQPRQVLLVVPSEPGYGAEGYNEIPGDATLIFVIDILAGS